jgi:4-amino-4-deoxy-L-arabinose transferase-like glycosyltransferase
MADPAISMPGRKSVWSAIFASPGTAFAAFAALHTILWTLLPAFLFPNLPLDLIEALVYGREWQLGHDKLPPLPWWIVEILYRAFGTDIAYYAFSQLTVLAAFALVFATARKIVGGWGAMAAVLIVDGMHYFNFTASKFNHDVIQLPFWALAGFAFHAALREGRLRDWLLLGAAIGFAFWSKYFVAVLVVPVVVFILLDRDARRTLATPGPWLGALAAFAVAAPHLVWLVQNNFLPLHYADERALPASGILDHIRHPARFLGAQLATLLPSIFIAGTMFVLVERRTDANPFDRRIVTLLAFGPTVAVIALSAVTGRALVTLWGYPLWLFFGLWIVMASRTVVEALRVKYTAAAWAGMLGMYVVGFVGNYGVVPHYSKYYYATLFPGTAFAQRIADGFRDKTGRPLDYLISTMWLGGNVSHYASGIRPRVLIDGQPQRAPWIDLADLRKKGAVVVWVDEDTDKIPERYRTIAANAELQPGFSLPFLRGKRDPLKVGWAILPPEK